MDALRNLAEAMRAGSVDQVSKLTNEFHLLAATDLGLENEELVEVGLDIVNWFVENNATHEALRLCLAVLELLEKGSSRPLMLALVRDRLAELYLERGRPDVAAEIWKSTLNLTTPIEGEDSDGALYRMEMRAKAIEQIEGSNAARLATSPDERAADQAVGSTRSTRRTTSDRVEDSPFELVSVYFGTHRDRTNRMSPYDYFRGRRSLPMTYGKAVVSVPKNREIGELPKPPRWVGEARANPARYCVIKSIDLFGKSEGFWRDLKESINVSERKEALVFIHGYNTSFANALLRVAQLATDLEINGAAVLYSWPSKGNILSYLMDKNEAIAPLIHEVKELIRDLASQTGAQRVHLVAHSMGGEFLLSALEELVHSEMTANCDHTSKCRSENVARPLFAEIIFASPDVDVLDFVDRISRVKMIAQRITTYSSAHDIALKWSEWANGATRAGATAEQLVCAGIECVDTTKTQSMGHDDYALSAIDDMRAIVWLSLAPEKRRTLRAGHTENGTYWIHDPSLLDAEERSALRQAIVWARRLGIQEALRALSGRLAGPIVSRDEQEQQRRYSAIYRELNALVGSQLANGCNL